MADMQELVERITIDVQTAGRVLGLAKGAAYRAVHAGEIPSIRIGGRILVPTAPLRQMLGIGEAPQASDTAKAA